MEMHPTAGCTKMSSTALQLWGNTSVCPGALRGCWEGTGESSASEPDTEQQGRRVVSSLNPHPEWCQLQVEQPVSPEVAPSLWLLRYEKSEARKSLPGKAQSSFGCVFPILLGFWLGFGSELFRPSDGVLICSAGSLEGSQLNNQSQQPEEIGTAQQNSC